MHFYFFIKRCADIVFSLMSLIILSPLFLIVTLAIALTSKGPVIFGQERHGKNMKVFRCYKFRTMKTTTVKFDIKEAVIDGTNKSVTPVGRVLRKLKIDELPQLINVLKGDMSVIGPRPFMKVYMDQYEPWELQKFAVRPGLTGLNQVKGNGYLSTPERSYYDVTYSKKISLFMDVGIFLKTFLVIIVGEKAFLKHVPEEKITEMKEQYEREVQAKQQQEDKGA